jgi:hypothetical protein
MNANELSTAIHHLKPTAQFSFTDADYSTIKWDVLDGQAPTISDLDAAHLAIQEAKAQAEAEAQAKRFVALAKLEALGLNEADLKALGL